ncbi:MAG: hypothetical protein ABIW19_14400 [Vicinamibacterales bacterium]
MFQPEHRMVLPDEMGKKPDDIPPSNPAASDVASVRGGGRSEGERMQKQGTVVVAEAWLEELIHESPTFSQVEERLAAINSAQDLAALCS